MVLVDAIVNGVTPSGSTTDLIRAAVSLNNKQVPKLEAQTLQFTIEQLNAMDIGQI